MDNLIAIGRVRTFHGLFGYLKVQSFSGKYKHFSKPDIFYLKVGENFFQYQLENIKVSGDKSLIKFKGINNIDEARRFCNAEIWVDRKYAATLGKNEFYYSDIVGCDLFFNNEKRGTVVGIIDSTADLLLEIDVNEKKVLIPFRKEFIGDCDVANKKIVLLEEWFLNEN